jgi:hypothetical protein
MGGAALLDDAPNALAFEKRLYAAALVAACEVALNRNAVNNIGSVLSDLQMVLDSQ